MNMPNEYSAAQVTSWMQDMAARIRPLTASDDVEPAILGIKTGGVIVARELHRQLGYRIPCGELNISFYRDDFSRIGLHPQVGASSIPFEVDGRTLILVDDVLYSGRTVRAAMNEIFDYGRPNRIILVVLVERDGRELPIQPDITGLSVQLSPNQQLKLRDDLRLQFV